MPQSQLLLLNSVESDLTSLLNVLTVTTLGNYTAQVNKELATELYWEARDKYQGGQAAIVEYIGKSKKVDLKTASVSLPAK